MARVHSTRGPRCPMELEILDGRNIKSSYRDTVGVRQDKSALHRTHRMTCFSASAQKQGERLICSKMGIQNAAPLQIKIEDVPSQNIKDKPG